MRMFQLFRPNQPDGRIEDGTGVQPGEVSLEGVVFSDGTVSIRWCTGYKSFSNWDSFEDFDKVHGHPEYGTYIRWLETYEVYESSY